MQNKYNDQRKFLELDKISFQKENAKFEDISWEIRDKENWAITGSSGVGKTLLVQAILGRIYIKNGRIKYHFLSALSSNYNLNRAIAYISFSEESNVFSYSNHYYQQRFNSTEAQDSITVKEFLGEVDSCNEWIKLFKLEELLGREFIKLSNGQTRKVRIVKALLGNPRLIILDEPFVGLDQESKWHLKDILNQMETSDSKILFITNSNDLPDSVTHVLELENFKIKSLGPKEKVLAHNPLHNKKAENIYEGYLQIKDDEIHDFKIAAQFNNVNITYDEKKILKNINWTVNKGEKWALLGQNGAGKTTLLSLINADNPQAYSQDIILFDRKRGTGESIWDIKKRIGFLSPELHMYFKSDMDCLRVAATGFVDTLFFNRDLSKDETSILFFLFNYFESGYLKERPFLRISTGQQKLVLFIRALIKNPPLLILDEPFQGMDFRLINQCRKLLDEYLSPSKTLIFVTHNPAEIPASVEKVYYLDEGEGTVRGLSTF